MSEDGKDVLQKDPQIALLQELQSQRDTLAAQVALMNGQVDLQQMFVDTRAVVASKGTRKTFDANYQGKPVIVEIEECFSDNTSDSRGVNVRDNMRIMVADKNDNTLLVDLGVTKPRNSESWTADIGRYHAPTTLHGGNPGITWEHAAGLVTPEGLANNGLLPEVTGVVTMMHEVATALATPPVA